MRKPTVDASRFFDRHQLHRCRAASIRHDSQVAIPVGNTDWPSVIEIRLYAPYRVRELDELHPRAGRSSCILLQALTGIIRPSSNPRRLPGRPLRGDAEERGGRSVLLSSSASQRRCAPLQLVRARSTGILKACAASALASQGPSSRRRRRPGSTRSRTLVHRARADSASQLRSRCAPSFRRYLAQLVKLRHRSCGRLHRKHNEAMRPNAPEVRRKSIRMRQASPPPTLIPTPGIDQNFAPNFVRARALVC